MLISQTPEEIQVASALIAKCELKRVRLHRCSASLVAESATLTEPFKWRVTYDSTAGEIVENKLPIQVQFSFESFDASEENAVLFNIECTFDLDYELEPKYRPSAESVDAFKNGNAIFNCWPYARECVQSITAKMALQPPPLPLLRIAPKKSSAPNVVTVPHPNPQP
jgi:hypothetical protein